MKMRKQRCMGLVLVLLSLLVVKMASTGTTPEDSDATVTVLLGPLGIYMMVTKQYILYDGEEANSEPNTEEEQKGVKQWQERELQRPRRSRTGRRLTQHSGRSPRQSSHWETMRRN